MSEIHLRGALLDLLGGVQAFMELCVSAASRSPDAMPNCLWHERRRWYVAHGSRDVAAGCQSCFWTSAYHLQVGPEIKSGPLSATQVADLSWARHGGAHSYIASAASFRVLRCRDAANLKEESDPLVQPHPVKAAAASRMASTTSSSSPPLPAASPGAGSPAEERRGGGRPPVPPYVKAAAGSLGGVMEACCLQPIDVVKTRLQLDRAGAYRGIAHCGATVARAEGVRALWKGLTPFATHLTLKYALRLGSNAVLQSAFKDPATGKVSAHGRLASGFGAGVIEALLIVTPFEVVKIRLQQQKGLSPDLLRYKGPIHCAKTIIREEGLFGLWSGALPTVMRNGTNQAAMFTAKNTFDIVLWKKHEGDGKVLLPWQSMISGFLAGTAGPICTGPFDVVKTRLMAQGKTGDIKYTGMVHAIRTIYAEEGLRALWKGLLPRLMRIPPGQAIMWAVADQVMGLYERAYVQAAHV